MQQQAINTNRPSSFGRTMLAVAWSFVGLRRRKDFDEDVGALKPLYVVCAGVAGAALFVLTLLTVVQLVVK